jgi:hypothetical protein
MAINSICRIFVTAAVTASLFPLINGQSSCIDWPPVCSVSPTADLRLYLVASHTVQFINVTVWLLLHCFVFIMDQWL